LEGLKERLSVAGGGAGFFAILFNGREVGRTIGRERGWALLIFFCTAWRLTIRFCARFTLVERLDILLGMRVATGGLRVIFLVTSFVFAIDFLVLLGVRRTGALRNLPGMFTS
jgi:hypothetical protein